MNEYGLILLFGIIIGITFMLIVCFIVFTNDNETILKLQNELINQQKENLNLKLVIKTIAEGDEEDGE